MVCLVFLVSACTRTVPVSHLMVQHIAAPCDLGHRCVSLTDEWRDGSCDEQRPPEHATVVSCQNENEKRLTTFSKLMLGVGAFALVVGAAVFFSTHPPFAVH